MGWDERSPFERMMDEIAAATSVREVDHLGKEARAAFADHPRFADLETLLDVKRQLLTAEADA